MPRAGNKRAAPRSSTATVQRQAKKARGGGSGSASGRRNTRSMTGGDGREEEEGYGEDVERVGGDGDDDEEDEDEEDEEDDGAEETRRALRELQSAMERTEKKDNYAKEFEKFIADEEKRVVGVVDGVVMERFGTASLLPLPRLFFPCLIVLLSFTRESESEEFRSRFVSMLATALSPTVTKESKPSSSPKTNTESAILGDPSFDKHPLYLKSQALVQCSKSLLQEYDDMTTYLSTLEAPPDPKETWARDCAEARRLIAIGMKASQAEIERLLDHRKAVKKDSKESNARAKGKREMKVFEKDEHLQAMLKMGRSDGWKEKPSGWGNVAHRAVRGMKALVKALADEADD
ncbi:hypothetical protein FQN50_007667 [Emmonsiellopsis sp. PD_5]|nr:hypothetical protein FQN50_007667 [Emmonsiellopsis sp. PD_5]